MRLLRIGTTLLLAIITFSVVFVDAQLTGTTNIESRVVKGVVYDGDTGQSLAGATLKVYNASGLLATLQDGENPYVTTQGGQFKFAVLPGTYRIEVQKDGYVSSVLGGVDVRYGSNSSPHSPQAGEYFYVANPEVTVDVPMQKVVQTSQVTENTKVLFVTPDGQLSSTCTIPPVITDITPLPQSVLGSLLPTITFRVLRGDPSIEGVNKDCINLLINGKKVQPTITGTKEEYSVSYTPDTLLEGETKVRIEACDLNPDPNRAIKEFSFFSISPYHPSANQTLDDNLANVNQLISTGAPTWSYWTMLLLFGAVGIAYGYVSTKKK